jgi:hypothetical protein
VLAGAVALHLGIGACLGMWTFGLIMLVGCSSFLPDGVVRRLAATPSRRRAAEASANGPFAVIQDAFDRGGRPGAREPVLTADAAR